MHFSKIYIQDNFVPDYATDPYRRKVIGIEMTVREGENLSEAIEQGEYFIKEYISKNKIESPHIIERYIPEEQLPIVQTEKEGELSLQEQIESCTSSKVLETYKFIVRGKPEQFRYDILMEYFLEQEQKTKQLQP